MGLFGKLLHPRNENEKNSWLYGYREGYPAATDAPTPATVNRKDRQFKLGFEQGRMDCQRMRQSVPQIFDVDGRLRDDTGRGVE